MLVVWLAGAFGACATDSNERPLPNSAGAGVESSGGEAANGGAPAGGAPPKGGSTVIGVDEPPAGGETAGGACAGAIVKGEPIPLDIHVMLDSSTSMGEPVDADTSKWAAVKLALSDFIQDEASAGLSVGIQYFPLASTVVPTSCSSSDDCSEGGECIAKHCPGAYQLYGEFLACDPLPCFSGSCVPLAYCAAEPTQVCSEAGADCGGGAGTCTATASSTCAYSASCDAGEYAVPAEEIALLPAAASALLTSLAERQLRGDTPTAPALAGVIDHASSWAEQHPDHTVVALLATDGLPSRCDEQSIEGIAALAQAGVDRSPSILTYVIGVFGPQDVDAETNLDTIAEAGGTTDAFMVHTDQDVTAQFLQALEAIRGTRLVCEFTIPEPPVGETLDYGQVNVRLSEPASTTTFPYVGSREGCGADGGWYYDTEPALGAPTRIVSCPATCSVLQAASDGEMQIELGCETVTTIVK